MHELIHHAIEESRAKDGATVSLDLKAIVESGKTREDVMRFLQSWAGDSAVLVAGCSGDTVRDTFGGCSGPWSVYVPA